MKAHTSFSQTIFLLTALLLVRTHAADVLENAELRVDFGPQGLTALTDLKSGHITRFANDDFSIQIGKDLLTGDGEDLQLEGSTVTTRTYRLESKSWQLRVVYELQPGWRFVSKQLRFETKDAAPFRVGTVEVFRGEISGPISREHKLRDGALLRLAESSGTPRSGLFAVVQNPFVQWSRTENRIALTYSADMDWNPKDGPFRSDRFCLGPFQLTGNEVPAAIVPEWKYVAGGALPAGPGLDWAEIEALTDCVRAFLLARPRVSSRVHVGWCENDFQIDTATPEGRAEYQRIIDQAAALGCRHLLYSPANSALSSLGENRDAWAWENILWFGLGQKIRKDEWIPGQHDVPESVQEMLDYAKAREVKLLAYVFPSLPFLQEPAWTKWITKQLPGGYLGADTGDRSFQDWLVAKLVAFQKQTGAGGFSFDHWWIGYDDASSKYAQWAGCRRVLGKLREELPDAVLDGRQQYHFFGAWTWLAGSYPHPLASDEQPQSFRAFPDLHIDRVSANRQRSAAWWFRIRNFCPPEIMPGFIGHQTPRMDEKNTTRRDRFRARDWDMLGWRYSLISSLATAPFQHVVNMIPARDTEEFTHFSDADKKWFRDWLDWTDANLETLRHLRPILGQPMLGRVDGSAAFKGAHGFVFLFNPNYRELPAKFTLDATIGLNAGKRFVLRQLYPEAGKGRLLAPRNGVFWNFGDPVSLPIHGAEGLVLEISPAPESSEEPLSVGLSGRVVLHDDVLDLSGVADEPGGVSEARVLVPEGKRIRVLSVNGVGFPFQQTGDAVSVRVTFAGAPFRRCQQVGTYDPLFGGGKFTGTIAVPQRIFQQLAERKRQWPIDYTEEEAAATWLASQRLLLFVNIAEPSDKLDVLLKIDGQPVALKCAYTSVLPQVTENTFVGWYADVSALKPDVAHDFDLELPPLRPGQFQGLFFDNVETESTSSVQAAP